MMPAQKSESPAATEQTQEKNTVTAAIVAPAEAARKQAENLAAARKAFATLAARAALAGHTCTLTSAGNIVLSRWGYAKIFDTTERACEWLDLVSGDRHA